MSAFLTGVAACLILASSARAGALAPAPASAGSVIAAWPEKARLLAAAMIQEYGAPDEVNVAELTWRHSHPWTMLVVFRDAQSAEHPNNLLEALAYEVPLRRWRALNAFDRGVGYDPVRKELVARAETEGRNILAVNLADEIVRGRMSPSEAAAFYDRVVELARDGKNSSSMSRFQFLPALRAAAPRRPGPGIDLPREIDEFHRMR